MSAQNSAEDGYTVVLVGDQKSGKESLMARLCNPAADPEEYPSSGVGLQSLTFDVRDQDVKLNFSNVVAEYSRTLCQICLNGAHVVLLCFCTYVPETVQALKEDWLPKVRESAPDALAILVAFCATSHLDKEYVAEKEALGHGVMEDREIETLAQEVGAKKWFLVKEGRKVDIRDLRVFIAEYCLARDGLLPDDPSEDKKKKKECNVA